jgi:uncharacterized YigZ family protein
MEATYLSLSTSGTGIYKDKGSKFLAYAFPVENEEQIRQHLDSLRTLHPGARHVCYAYRINPGNLRERANDDGEPNHSAGTPILGQIHSKKLINVMVAVVRYFGGTKLGVPGLIHAYKSAAAEALSAASIVEMECTATISLRFAYPLMNEVMRILKRNNVRIISQQSLSDVEMLLSIREDRYDELMSQLTTIKNIIFVRLE